MSVSLIALFVATVAFWQAWRDKRWYRNRVSKLEQDVRAAKARLSQRGTLASEVAHEIKNPLSAILCSAESLDLLIGQDIKPEYRKSILYIKEYSDHLLRLLSDFIDLSRLEEQQVKPKAKPVNVVEEVESIIGLLNSNAIKKQLSIKHYFTEQKLIANCDARHLKQILFNLIHNAIKFSQKEGEIEIVAKIDFPNPYILISVNDSGIGISKEGLNRIFDPYQREGTRPEMVDGTGLGLAICKMLVELNGGVIAVRSEVGVGSSFGFTVPLANAALIQQEQSSNKQEGAALMEKPLTGQNILIVEKEEMARDAMARLIEALGATVSQVAEAKEAVTAVAASNYTTVIIDDQGYGEIDSLLKKIEESGGLNSTAVILATNHSRNPLKLTNPGIKLLEKPLGSREILRAVMGDGNVLN